ncbi:MAG: radical SAM protein [Deltaproteobacteria bacterium]|nr:radical SAM protein [Deltaproteobacteria bacterium]
MTILHLADGPRYWAARALRWPPPPPLSLTLSVTWRCNCRCLTCHVDEREADELSVSEYERFFEQLGRRLQWATLSGGEPSLRDDLPDIVEALASRAAPRVITLATNGTLCDRLPAQVEAMAVHFSGPLVVNLSFDAVGDEHDRLRGLDGAWQRALQSYRALKDLQRHRSNLVVGIHTVISTHNVERFPTICDALLALEPDSYITEIAEHRAELRTEQLDIVPSVEAYQRAIAHLERRLATRRLTGAARLVQALRTQYYRHVVQTLRHPRERLPCYAGILGAQLTPDGKLWDCCIRARELGDLRAAGGSFHSVWTSPQAQSVRREIRRTRCHCTLANAAYTNMLASGPALARIGLDLLRRPAR